jgi:hypothetical protein
VLDERVVRFRVRFQPKDVDLPFVGRSHELGPATIGVAPRHFVGNQLPQVAYPVLLPQPGDLRPVGGCGSRLRPLDRVKIRDWRYGDPVEVGDSGVAADDDPVLAGAAAAQFSRGLGADARKIDGHVPGGIEKPEGAVWLLEQQRYVRVELRGTRQEQE